MIVSTLQSVRRFCEHRDEDGPTDAWQGIEDRHVTMLLPLSRHVLPLIPGNRFGELFAEPVELQPGIGQLAIEEPQLRDHQSDVLARSLSCALSYSQSRLAQFTDHMGGVETAYAMALENASNGCLAHACGLFGRWCGFPEIEDQIRAKVVGELEHLRIVAPKLIPQPVGEPDALYLEFFVNA
jgi:hypothetical protein